MGAKSNPKAAERVGAAPAGWVGVIAHEATPDDL